MQRAPTPSFFRSLRTPDLAAAAFNRRPPGGAGAIFGAWGAHGSRAAARATRQRPGAAWVARRWESSLAGAQASAGADEAFPQELLGLTSRLRDKYTDRNTYASTLRPTEEATSLLPEAYTKPEFYELEKEKIWTKAWVCVGYASDIPQKGDTKAVNVAGQSVILTRDKKGVIRAFHNCCRHRGSRIVDDSAAPTNYKVLTCPYHAWSWSLDGKLLGTSMFNKGRRETKIEKHDASFGLFPVQVDHWGPFLFVNLNDDNKMSLHQYLGDMPQKYSRYIAKAGQDGQQELHDWRVVRHKPYTVNANWKNTAENFNDWYHLPWVHPGLSPTSTVGNHVILQGEGMYTGFGTVPLSSGGTPADADFLPPLSTLDETEKKSALFFHVFPNLSLFFLPGHVFSLLMLPQAHDKTYESGDLLMTGETLRTLNNAENDIKVDQIFSFWDVVNAEDVLACERVQVGQAAAAYTGGPFSQFEVMIHRLQQMVVQYVVAPAGQDPDLSPFFDPEVSKECMHYNSMRHD